MNLKFKGITLTVCLLSSLAFGSERIHHCDEDDPGDPNAVLDCVNIAYAGPFSRSESMDICTGARSIGPAQCAVRAYSGPFGRDESINFCKRTGTLAMAECAIKAYAGPYSREEALKLCKASPALLIRSLDLMLSSDSIRAKIGLMKAGWAEQ